MDTTQNNNNRRAAARDSRQAVPGDDIGLDLSPLALRRMRGPILLG
ncbi:MAG: hypothetical protein WA988_04745 [Candidatus Nanopelagicales bacterium]